MQLVLSYTASVMAQFKSQISVSKTWSTEYIDNESKGEWLKKKKSTTTKKLLRFRNSCINLAAVIFCSLKVFVSINMGAEISKHKLISLGINCNIYLKIFQHYISSKGQSGYLCPSQTVFMDHARVYFTVEWCTDLLVW